MKPDGPGQIVILDGVQHSGKTSIARPYSGQGLATEAAIAWRDHAFDALGRPCVISWMKADHLGSRRVAEKVWMTPEKEIRNEDGSRSVVYAMTAADHASRRLR